MKARLIKKFEDELMVLEKELKTELPLEIKRARELGDLRENAEYHAAKERQRLVEARISLLKKRVSDIHLMNLDKIPRDKVGFGSTVHLKDGATASVTVYQLVMPEDADVEHGLISTASQNVLSATCEMSTIIPSRFISRTTSLPKSVSPL